MLASVLPDGKFIPGLQNNPDFYGPFWIPTTVIFCLFATSTIAESIALKWSGKTIDSFDITVLTFAALIVYSYVAALPFILYLVSKYYKVTTVWTINQIKLFDLINVYGYSMTIWIPVSFLCIVPVYELRVVVSILSFAISGI